MPADPDRVKSLFLRAVELPPADRPALVAAVPDTTERAELARLLDAHDARLDATAPHAPDQPTDAQDTGDVGQELAGRYKLLERIGEGGMGTVWMAEQRRPVKRLVAVKLIKAGLDTKAVLARFEAERQALAIMDHPNIARVLDAGETSDGRPFFVMELVRGVPITRYCDDARLTPRQRLEMFVPVCQAIQHAHTKGVIHRDIKPGNVLVALYDGRPVPKVIDFGIAKAAGQPLTDKTLHTGFGAVVGTPEYMSPEQTTLNQLDIDTRSDVYSLGVLLYELLTGGPPFSHEELATAGLLEMLRVVREQEPPRPSAKLSTSTRLASLAAVRGTEPARLAELVRGEVDWIVMKSLEKDRTRRYETATGLAADVTRHLAGEPVQAVPPSAGYRLRKFTRRNRVVLAVTAGFLLLTWVAASGVYFAYRRAVAAEAMARDGQREAEDARQAEAMQRWEAERTAASLAVDLDLAEVGSDERSGLLRLARWYGQFPVGEAVLREFVAVPSLAVGQRFTPLLAVHLSPDTRDKLSPDGRTVLANRPGAALLMDVRSGREVAIRQATEQVLNAGWADGGRTAYTDSLDGVVRLWDTATGNLRAATAPRPLRHHPTFHDDGNGKEVCSVAGRRMVTWGCWEVLAAGSRRGNPSYTAGLRQPVELWDAGTGQLVRRFALPPTQLKAVKLLGDRWAVVAVEDHAPRVFSCITGDEVARLPVEDSVYDNVYINPSGTRLMVRSVSAGVRRWAWLEEWDTARWNRIHPPLKVDTMVTRYSTYLTDGVFA